MSRLRALCERAADGDAVGCPAIGCDVERETMDALVAHLDTHQPILRWAEQQRQLAGVQ